MLGQASRDKVAAAVAKLRAEGVAVARVFDGIAAAAKGGTLVRSRRPLFAHGEVVGTAVLQDYTGSVAVAWVFRNKVAAREAA